MVSSVSWHSLMAGWPSVTLLHDCVCIICSVYHCLWYRFLSSGMSLWYIMRRPYAYIVFVLYSKLCHCGMAWHSNSVAFSWFPSLPPLSWFRVSPSVLGFSLRFEGLFILLPLGFWPQCDGCYSGGLCVGGAGGWVADWWACGSSSALGCDCGCSPLCSWPMGTQPPLVTWALMYKKRVTSR